MTLRFNSAGAGLSFPLQGPNGSVSSPTYSFSVDPTTGAYRASGGDLRITAGGSDAIAFTSSGPIMPAAGVQFSQSGVASGSNAKLQADNENYSLAQRNGTNANVFRIYNTYTDSVNYERAIFDWKQIANTCVLGTQSQGSGAARTLRITSASVIDFAASGNNPSLRFSHNSLIPSADNVFVLGGSSNRFASFYQNGAYVNAGTVTTAPTTGATVTVNNVTRAVIIKPASTLAALTIDLPTGSGSASTGMEVAIAITQPITALNWTASSATVYGAPSTTADYFSGIFKYVAADAAWYLVS